jgi:hypothetical protein
MGILDFLFRPKGPGEPTYEIVARHWSIDEHRYQVRVKKAGREFYAEDLFQAGANPKDLNFSRFFLLNEKPPLPHFAPSLRQAVDWFLGRRLPKDGYNSIWWGDRVRYECAICKTRREMPLRITRVESLALATVIPSPREIVGWRVVEVESEWTGKGAPTKRLDDYKTVPVIKWDQFPNRYLCGNCARNLTALGREAELSDYFVFAVD